MVRIKMNNIKTLSLYLILFISILLTGSVKADLVVNAHNNFISFKTDNPGNVADPINVLLYTWGGIIVFDSELNSVDTTLDVVNDPKITSPALFYPSPFRIKDGTTLGFQLNQALDMDLRIYDMRGNEIYRTSFANTTEQGGKSGYNKIPFNQPGELFNRTLPENMPSGVYFYVLINEDDVLGKGKFAVLP
jgi:hypothetical protein